MSSAFAVVAIEKGAFGLPLTTVGQLATYIYIYIYHGFSLLLVGCEKTKV